MKFVFRATTLLFSLLCAKVALAGTVNITVNATNAGPKLNPQMYGIFLEEINHGVDGGLYAEMIRNRGFEDAKPPEGFTYRNGHWMSGRYDVQAFGRFDYFNSDLPFWSLVKTGGANGSMNLDMDKPLDPATPRSLRLDVEDVSSGRLGIANNGFWGIGVTAGKKYNLSFWARGEGFTGPLTAALEGEGAVADAKPITIKGVGTEWKPFKGTFTATKTDANASFLLTAGAQGKIWFDMVSLFPAETFKGRANGLRPDLAQFLADMKPGFIRFPGGCVIEGGSVETAFNWKDSVGPLEKREEQFGPWGYRETHGMGMYEYLQFCEDIGAAPLYVGFAGETCHFRNKLDVPMDQMGWVVTNFLDAIEYANGPASTPWGKLRAESGHPNSFNLKLIEIGNEGEVPTYPPRYKLVHSILESQHPEISYINDFSFIRRQQMGTEKSDIEDNHYYENPQWFMSHTNLYDDRSRSLPPVYDGEVAVTSGEGTDPGDTKGNVLAALSEGAFLMGLEHNADVVKMVSYAPLLANVKGRTGWHGMIYFDTLHSYATVSYYLWKLFSLNRPDYTLATGVDFHADALPPIAGAVGVGTWNNSAEFKDVRVEKEGKVLYASDFTNGAAGWTKDGGNWSVVDGAYRQSRPVEGLSYIGDDDWSNYTLTLKARKVGARGEGFLIVFGKEGSDRYWWNVGGYGNTQHGVELNQTVLGRQTRGTLEADRWYSVKIVVNNRNVQCFLDDQLINNVTVPAQDKFFANAGRDLEKGDVVIKAINVSSAPVGSTIDLSGFKSVGSKADVTVLASALLTDNNTMRDPKKVVPVNLKTTVSGNKLDYQFPPNSLTIIRVPVK